MEEEGAGDPTIPFRDMSPMTETFHKALAPKGQLHLPTTAPWGTEHLAPGPLGDFKPPNYSISPNLSTGKLKTCNTT
jgi:hypothetical protein